MDACSAHRAFDFDCDRCWELRAPQIVANALARPRTAEQVARAEAEIDGRTYYDEDTVAEARALWGSGSSTSRWEGYSAAVEMLGALGMSLGEMAKEFGVTPMRVASALVMKDERADQVLLVEGLLRNGGHSFASVARRAGVHTWTVSRIAKTLNLKSAAVECRRKGGGDKYTAEQIAKAIELRTSGMTYEDIAQEMGLERWQQAHAILRRRMTKPTQAPHPTVPSQPKQAAAVKR